MKKMQFVIGVMACLLFFTACGKENNDVVTGNLNDTNQEQVQENKEENKVEQPNEENKEENKVEQPNEENKEENKVEQPNEENKEENKVEQPNEENKEENKVEQPNEENKEENKVEQPNEENKEDNKVEQPNEENKEENKVEQPNETKTLSDVMNSVVTKAQAEVRAPMLEAIPAEMSYGFIGIQTEVFNTYVEESVVYESMISPAFQSICIVKVNDSTKVEELKKSILDNCDLRKWVCTSAERAVVVNSGNYILLAMAEDAKCDELVKAFSDEFGGNIGEILSKIAG